MFIGIDGNEANIEQRVGIGQYAYQVLTHLYKSQKLRERINFKVYLKNKPITDLPTETSWWKYKVFGPKILWTQLALPASLFLEKEKPNVFFTPSHYAPRFSPVKTVISIMDLSFIFFPNMFRKKDLHQLKSWTAYSVKKAEKIFTISQFSKNAIIDYYRIPENKVVMIYPGYDKNKYQSFDKLRIDPERSRMGQKLSRSNRDKNQKYITKIKNKYNLGGDYILFVGTLQQRKNIVRLIEGFNAAMQQCGNEAMRLVIVGKKGWLYEDIFKKVEELRLDKRVIFTDYVPDDDMPDFYRGAKCLVLPSLHEGFGLPVIEAMACGCPVVVSNVSSLPEIVGDAGILVEPKRVEEIAEGICQASFNPEKRNQLIRSGLERVKIFSWDECARKTLDVLKEVASLDIK